MNRKQLAAILITCAAVLAGGAYVLLSHAPGEGPVLRQTVAPTAELPAKAPDWVNTGQTPEPDYAPAASQAHNATPAPSPASAPAPKAHVVEIKEDKMVTFAFVESLVDHFLANFTPVSKNGNPATRLSATSLNLRYGRDLDLLSVDGDDISAMRKAVLNHVFVPAAIETLSAVYGPFFVQELTDAALSREREYKVGVETEIRALTATETAAMLRLDAGVLERTATALRAIATDQELTVLTGQYLQASKAVKRANAQLQKALSDQRETQAAGERYKQAILQRENVRSAVVTRLRKSCSGCPAGDLFYIAQWAYRRTLGDTAKLAVFASAADGLDAVSARLLEKSVELKGQQSP
ncbi:MAG: hypothetical protein V3571_03570 [Pseudodesulfovibrio sp.]